MTSHGDPDVLKRRANEIAWYHRMDLGQGVVTNGLNNPLDGLARLSLPARLDGKRVLDIGAWDGFYSFEAERRGAAEVLATDSFSWGGGGWGTKAGFELAREALGSQVRDLTVDVFDLDPAAIGRFDVVLFLGVLYHLKNPIEAIERVAAVTSGLLVLETEVDLMLVRGPAAAFYGASELNRDPTNWWGPNPAAVAGMLRAAGFERVDEVWRRRLPARVGGWLRHRRHGGRGLIDALNRHRAVFHAWRSN